MGSNSSTHVRSIEAEHIRGGTAVKSRKNSTVGDGSKETTKAGSPKKSTVKKLTKVGIHEKDVQNEDRSEAATDIVTKNSLQLTNLENQLEREHTQLAEIERQNLELQDYIDNLEAQLEAIDRENESKGKSGDFSETLKVKEQEIRKLEKEKEAVNSEMGKLRIKFKKKIRILNTKLTEQKNEGSVQALEMREEIKTLKEENAKLQERLNAGSGFGQNPTLTSPKNDHQGQTSVILELSSRVSEQDARIVQLENTLHDKNKEIDRLQTSLEKACKNVREKDCMPYGAECNDTEEGTVTSPASMSTAEKILRTDVQLGGDTDWYGNKTFEQISRQAAPSAITPKDSSRSYPGRDLHKRDDTDSAKSELQAIAEEMKQLRKRRGKSKRSQAVTRSPVYRNADNDAELSGRDSGLSVDSQNQSPISASAPNIGCHRTGSGVSHTSSVLSNDAGARGKVTRKYPPGGVSLRERPPSGGVRYDADISQCDTDMGFSDKSDNERGLEYEDSEGGSSSTALDRSSIRQISAPRTKKRKGLLKSLLRKDSAELDSTTQEGADQMQQKPPVYKVKPKDPAVQDADMLINSIDEDLLFHKKTSSNSFSLTAVS